ncbi:MAG: succinate dehydrogenase/fumarate reductase iron-sulfur subunit [Actinobacteria bacterium]|nr:succinate dehydrogenase/fumarate reductase iron-sulfur subunit [Actinomycetota bacterium]
MDTATLPEPATTTRTLRVSRFSRDGRPPRFEEFEVPVTEGTTVLEALRWIRVHRDAALGLRHSCFHASCGTCGMRVNGREVLACVTDVASLGQGPVTIEPIANLPLLQDLVVDMASFYARFPLPPPLVRTSELVSASELPEGIDAHERFEDCIECGLCLSACPVVATDETYVGPAALAYAQRLLEEDRGADRAAILSWADDDNAAWRCHAAFECTEACPSDVRPAERIMALRRELVLHRETVR